MRGCRLLIPRVDCQAHLFLKGESSLGKAVYLVASNRGFRGACGPTWVLEGQATIAWVFLELDLFQGEDGGSWTREEGRGALMAATLLAPVPTVPTSTKPTELRQPPGKTQFSK